jgi:hypothetical protein
MWGIGFAWGSEKERGAAFDVRAKQNKKGAAKAGPYIANEERRRHD